MKPNPFTSVHDFLAQGVEGKPARAALPYDTYAQTKAGFLTLASNGDFTALPLDDLRKASLYGDARTVELDFGPTVVKIEGHRLESLFEDILLCRVRVIRTGKHPACAVDAIGITKAIGTAAEFSLLVPSPSNPPARGEPHPPR